MKAPSRSYPCPVCHEEVPLPLTAPADVQYVCIHCHTLLRLDTDAEFAGGLWRDRSALHRVLDPLPEGGKPEEAA